MDSIDTIMMNFGRLSNTPIDWSLNGGMIWLTGMTVFMALYIAALGFLEARKERRRRRQALYRRAEQSLQVRRRILDQNGYFESF